MIGWACLGGHPKAKTPHLDSFAKDGAMVFQNAHCPEPVCAPSKYSEGSGSEFAWGVACDPIEKTSDYVTAAWAGKS